MSFLLLLPPIVFVCVLLHHLNRSVSFKEVREYISSMGEGETSDHRKQQIFSALMSECEHHKYVIRLCYFFLLACIIYVSVVVITSISGLIGSDTDRIDQIAKIIEVSTSAVSGLGFWKLAEFSQKWYMECIEKMKSIA